MTKAPRTPATRQPAEAPKARGRKAQDERARTEVGVQRAIAATKPLAEQPARARKPRARGSAGGEKVVLAVERPAAPVASVPTTLQDPYGRPLPSDTLQAPVSGAVDPMFLSIREIPSAAVPAPSGFGYRSDGTLDGAPDSVNDLLRDATARAAGGASLAEIFEDRTRGPVAPPVLDFSAAPAAGAPGVAESLRVLEKPARSKSSIFNWALNYPVALIVACIPLIAVGSMWLISHGNPFKAAYPQVKAPAAQAEQTVPSEQPGVTMLTESFSSIDYYAVHDRLSTVRDTIQSLYSDAVAATPTAGGKVTFVLKVNGNGTVASVSVESKDDSLPQEFVDVVAKELKALNGFPLSRGSYPVTVPYRFGQTP